VSGCIFLLKGKTLNTRFNLTFVLSQKLLGRSLLTQRPFNATFAPTLLPLCASAKAQMQVKRMLWRQPIGLRFRKKMKKVFLVFSTLIVISLSVFTQEIKFRIDGKLYNKQIYDENNNQITNFKNWELIQDFYISPDNKKMLVYHRPDKAKAFLMTLYNLKTKKIIAECEPGWACDDVKWTKNYLIKV